MEPSSFRVTHDEESMEDFLRACEKGQRIVLQAFVDGEFDRLDRPLGKKVFELACLIIETEKLRRLVACTRNCKDPNARVIIDRILTLVDEAAQMSESCRKSLDRDLQQDVKKYAPLMEIQSWGMDGDDDVSDADELRNHFTHDVMHSVCSYLPGDFVHSSVARINKIFATFVYSSFCPFNALSLHHPGLVKKVIEMGFSVESLKFTSIAEAAMARALCPTLKSADLVITGSESSHIGIGPSLAICRTFDTVRSLTIRGMNSAFHLNAALAEAKMTELRLDHVQLCKHDMEVIHRILSDSGCRISTLSMEACSIDENIAFPLNQGLCVNQSVKKLSLVLNPLGRQGIRILLSNLAKNQHLQEIDIGSTEIGDSGAMFIADYFIHGGSIEKLAIGSNGITSVGATWIFGAVIKGGKVKDLDMEYNRIGVEGARILALNYSTESSIERLCLDYCDVGDAGAKHIGKILADAKKLHHLSLTWNNIRKDGAKSIAAGLRKNKGLEILDLSGCHIEKIGVEEIVNALAQNPKHTLKKMDICWQDLPEGADEKLRKALLKEFKYPEHATPRKRRTCKGCCIQ